MAGGAVPVAMGGQGELFGATRLRFSDGKGRLNDEFT